MINFAGTASGYFSGRAPKRPKAMHNAKHYVLTWVDVCAKQSGPAASWRILVWSFVRAKDHKELEFREKKKHSTIKSNQKQKMKPARRLKA